MSLIAEGTSNVFGEFDWRKRLAEEMNDNFRWSATLGPATLDEINEQEVTASLDVTATWAPSPDVYLWLQEHHQGSPLKFIRPFGGGYTTEVNAPHNAIIDTCLCTWDDEEHTLTFGVTIPYRYLSYGDILAQCGIALPQVLGIVLCVNILPGSAEFPPIMPASEEYRESHTTEHEDPETGMMCYTIPAGGGALIYKYRLKVQIYAEDQEGLFNEPVPATINIRFDDDRFNHWTSVQDYRKWHNHIYDLNNNN